ncbi:MAG: HlyD family efflux transporter periplasmic adaptor subunit [Clostridiales bacterium]|nr:HlyD family efflux transporter periplasmic adaptor subunit [Clostridiales bacterium]
MAGILALLILIGGGIGYYFIWNASNYLTTDNAKVTAKFYAITPLGAGKLSKLSVHVGSAVKANEIIGKVDSVGYLRSPIDGEVVQVNVSVNQLVGASTVAAVVADTADIYVQANIEETEIAKIAIGQSVKLKLDAYPGMTFGGFVREIDRTTQTAISGNTMSYSTSGTYTKVTQLIPVKIQLSDSVDLENLIGTNATVTIELN